LKARVKQAPANAAICARRSKLDRGVSRVILVLTALTVVLFALAPGVAQAEEKVTTTAEFSPDLAGAPTLVKGTSKIINTTGKVPSPITKISIVGPAGLGLNLKGVGTCTSEILLSEAGPKRCPRNSVAGEGGGTGVFELAGEIIREHFSLELFRGPDQNGHIVLLIYVNAISPVSVQLVFAAPVTAAPKPYGLGFSFEVPLIHTLPEASDASVESAYLNIGATAAQRKRFHVKGILVPKSCPAKGFPYQTQFSFEDGSTVTTNGTIPCPKGRAKHH
jgi:hypothetical protein